MTEEFFTPWTPKQIKQLSKLVGRQERLLGEIMSLFLEIPDDKHSKEYNKAAQLLEIGHGKMLKLLADVKGLKTSDEAVIITHEDVRKIVDFVERERNGGK